MPISNIVTFHSKLPKCSISFLYFFYFKLMKLQIISASKLPIVYEFISRSQKLVPRPDQMFVLNLGPKNAFKNVKLRWHPMTTMLTDPEDKFTVSYTFYIVGSTTQTCVRPDPCNHFSCRWGWAEHFPFTLAPTVLQHVKHSFDSFLILKPILI